MCGWRREEEGGRRQRGRGRRKEKTRGVGVEGRREEERGLRL